ncbi:cholesterol esterase [Streptomyces mobaraensis NBRC 13819 = DSM 40847]|uniref:Cholesterol esterase n=2 Tax=Streptomyces mobaraensis TaxID=35621 RepID=A0A5N5WEB3_STRMB|nr:DUF6230 family protein [Streptomyces mobaraensis]EME97870.1 cholesterol esterase [Streptomyces mobaraensis NBRC 13819 = DSM 40847]KAB7851222.1 cholesterol esterase [Streptomyces mobaraensis]QTT75771.1 cholesterol esterase [Streptomyces mobaraensis NBRC 13819 = DSM 40847]
MKSQARGGTRWKRFAVVMVPSVGAAAAVTMAIAQGALAASFQVSGQQFQITAKHIHGEGFGQYGAMEDTDPNAKDHKAVAVVGMNRADITNLCQAVNVPTPFGAVGLKLKAGGGDTKVVAKQLYLDANEMKVKKAQFNKIDIGVSSDHMTQGPGKNPGDKTKSVPGSFAQQAETVDFDGVEQQAWATSAGSFTLPDLHMSVGMGGQKCQVGE